ncbi:recombinase family protein [Paenibacillus nicotianae]|uniref:Recombinase family protein n=1 Tax=Paenibacillus nicotianae TaxID=1526551 RepID=A0ABW4UZC9_9BACL
MELNEDYAPIVKEIFDLYFYKNWGMHKISNYLIEKGIPTPRTVSGEAMLDNYGIKAS